jgi:hypothetical protein
MARGNPRRTGTARPQGHPRRTKASYRHALKDAIGHYLPGQFFCRWGVRAGCRWTPQRVVWLAILMAWSAEQTLQARFEDSRQVLRAVFPKWSLGTTYTGWSDAQAKWLTPLRPALARRLRQRLQESAGRQWRREGWCAFAVDGSRIECPRTAANQQELGCAGRKKTGPQLFLTTLWHMGTGLPWDFRIGSGKASERRHLEQMLPQLPRQSIVVADAGFTGYQLYRRLLAARQNFLLRVGSNVHLLRQLGYFEREGRDTVYLWPEKQRRRRPLVLRLLRRRQGKRTMYLVTNVLDKAALSAESAGVLYEMRWGVEVFFRSLKQTLQRRKMLSRSPQAAAGELTGSVLGLWLLGLLSVSAIVTRGGDPLSWSVALARQRVRRSLQRALTRRHPDRGLIGDLGRAVRDNYVRYSRKKARDWPHKKNEAPPGRPDIQPATREQKQAAQRIKEKMDPK